VNYKVILADLVIPLVLTVNTCVLPKYFFIHDMPPFKGVCQVLYSILLNIWLYYVDSIGASGTYMCGNIRDNTAELLKVCGNVRDSTAKLVQLYKVLLSYYCPCISH
jgi:hypothetical protein